MSIYDILACPRCKSDLKAISDEMTCDGCGRKYPIVNGVPILLCDPASLGRKSDDQLPYRKQYDPWIHRMVLQSLTDAHVVLDAGCGNMALDDPCIIRMDVALTPYVDVVGDLHDLPFKPSSLDYIFSLAVVEHLRQPFHAASEIYKSLKPGGYVYSEGNFIFAYHGHPCHYFNASLSGIREVFSEFQEIRAGVAPYQTPGFALENVIQTYLDHFRPATEAEKRFARALRHILDYPLRHYDLRIAKEEFYKLAAGVYFYGIKRPEPEATIMPAPIIEFYERTPELKQRFPRVHDLGVPDNIMAWAKDEGRAAFPSIDRFFNDLIPFSKYLDPHRPFERGPIKTLPPILHPDEQRIDDGDYERMELLSERSAANLLNPTLGSKAASSFSKQIARVRRFARKITTRLKKGA